ncbi:hypothetical protein KQI65_11755 [bacterium]|nr:hypothetical protein [bacterium]
MNERIQELITAYLHRGSTAEQERELFDACKRDPEVAEQLRQHLILSLKLRKLRDDVTVPPTLHEALNSRIASLAVDNSAAEDTDTSSTAVPAAAPAPAPRRFRLVHLFGTGVATAAAAAALVLLLLPGPETTLPISGSPVARLTDTMYIIKKDTVTQLREVTREVYIARNDNPAPSSVQQPQTVSTTEQRPATPASSPAMAGNGTGADHGEVDTPPANKLHPEERPSVTPEDRNNNGDSGEYFADARPVETLTPHEKTENYLDQYSAMLVTVASVQLTSADRISQ